MYLVDFMNAHSDNWQELLVKAPFYLDVRTDKINDTVYYILKYNMIQSDFSNLLVKEARGSIFREDEGKWVCVCWAMNKFHNYGEKYSDINLIDWSTARILQKVDGSLYKLWYDKNKWHVSTNGTIDAAKAACGDQTFLDLFNSAIENIEWNWDELNKNYCYYFELTSPFNHIVVHYSGIHLWYLGCRNMVTGKEENLPLPFAGLYYPQQFKYYSLAECVAAAKEMGVDEEGYVVVDDEFHRIKIKGNEYLRLHKMRGNGPLTAQRVIEMWQKETLDDFIAYYPEFQKFITSVTKIITRLIQLSDMAYMMISQFEDIQSRADFAQCAKRYSKILQGFLFARLDNKCKSANEYYRSFRARNLANYVNDNIEVKNVGVANDV